ncbi:MAG: TetR/AcrR family transcriptional regulator [Flavobacterium sp.]|nr:TetR/AcrR family transcriptional regulator [Flavobacterium sp.]
MAATKKIKEEKILLDENQIITFYMNDVLEDNHNIKNVYVFCKNNQIEEADFYSFYGSLEAVKESIWVKFFENAVMTIEKDENYFSYTNKNKLLTLYFTMFEILTLNRSYVVYSLEENKEGMKNLKQLKQLRNRLKDFVVDIMETSTSENDNKVAKVTQPVFSEGAWIQFLFILKFWLDDNSRGFEKTDIIIEKSVNTVVDLLDTKPLENLIDLGKFLWKESKMR